MEKTRVEFNVCKKKGDVLLLDQELFVLVKDWHFPGLVEKIADALRSSDRNRASVE